ncbi:MAG: hypothetical protein Q8N44_06230 [Rubrivivax sp.]|nr:hypothetical protein [Rubrivivax sp.]
MTRADFAYAQARLQARHGRLPPTPLWQALEASRTAAHYLALASSGPLAPWVEGLADAAAHDVHGIEHHLRQRWRAYVDEVARWLPARWQPATRLFGDLVELPLKATPQPGGSAPVPPDAAARWLDGWQRLLPPAAGDAALLRRPAELLLPRLRGASSGRAAQSEPAQHALLRLFRRHGLSALAVFAHLALVALMVERLRGGWVVRVLLEPRPEPQPS